MINLVENHIWQGATDRPLYLQALKELEARSGFDFETSLNAIKAAAKAGRFLSYKDLADANDVDWTKPYRLIGGHLWDLVRWGYAKDLPMRSSIVVNKENLMTGEMAPDTLRGFIKAAEDLGYARDDLADPRAFLKDQQAKLFVYFAEKNAAL
ncbi:MAG: hypothetical protein HRU31_07630 [Rhodobacteraceae bacterium]|nr:hypothetical protein [Paracoccaceae bacterium]